MEIRTNTVDLVDRQMSGTGKKEGKTEEGISGFKTMLKDKNQKKNNGNTESRESEKDAQISAAETVVPYADGNVPKVQSVQNIEDKVIMPEQQVVNVLVNENSSGVTQLLDSKETEPSEGIDSMQFFNSLNIRNKIEKSGGIKLFGAELEDSLKADTGKAPEIGLVTEAGQQAVGKQINSLIDGTEGKNQGATDSIIASKTGSTLPATALDSKAIVTEPLIAAQAKKTETKKVTDNEDKTDEKTLEGFQEKLFEPTHVIRTEQDKDAVINMTVNPDNLEELEAKLSEQILNQIRAGKNNLELQLEPHNLGKILLKVSYEDNQVNVSIICSESKTLKLITQSANELGTILESNLERPIQVVVDKQEPDYLNNQQQEQHGSGQGQHHQNQEKSADDSSEDFMHKLRLGFFEADSAVSDEINDR